MKIVLLSQATDGRLCLRCHQFCPPP